MNVNPEWYNDLFDECLFIFWQRHTEKAKKIDPNDRSFLLCEANEFPWRQIYIEIRARKACWHIMARYDPKTFGFFSVASRYTFGSMVCEQLYVAARIHKISACMALEPDQITVCCELEPLGLRGFSHRHSVPAGMYLSDSSVGHILRYTPIIEGRIALSFNVDQSDWTHWTNHVPRFYSSVAEKTVIDVIKEHPENFYLSPDPSPSRSRDKRYHKKHCHKNSE